MSRRSVLTREARGTIAHWQRWRRSLLGSNFSAGQISGLQIQLAARLETGFADSDLIGAPTDFGPNAYSVTQGTSGNQPAFKTGILNGKPGFLFDGSNDYWNLPNALFSGATSGEAFVVLKLNADPPGTSTKTGLWSLGNPSTDLASNVPWTDGIIYDAFGTTIRKNTADPSTSFTGGVVYNVVSTSSNWTNYVNGTQLFNTATNTVAFRSSSLYLGRSNGTASIPADYYTDGYILEFLVYVPSLNSTDRATINSFLGSTYGLF